MDGDRLDLRSGVRPVAACGPGRRWLLGTHVRAGGPAGAGADHDRHADRRAHRHGAVKVETKDGKEMDAYRAMPATGQGFGTILVVQEIFGVHAHIADMCRRFAKAGYYAIAPELYFREGDPRPTPKSPSWSPRS